MASGECVGMCESRCQSKGYISGASQVLRVEMCELQCAQMCWAEVVSECGSTRGQHGASVCLLTGPYL